MTRFPGFPGRLDYVAIPKVFFSDVLPHISDSAELAVTLHLFRLLGAKRGYPRAVAYHEVAEDRALASGFTEQGRDFRAEAERGIAAAVARGTFLLAEAPAGGRWLLLHNEQSRRAVAAIQRGRLAPPASGQAQSEIAPVPVPQQDVFTLYEENIGLLTPIIAERLQEAEREYPAAWLQEAFGIAAERNQRHWRYVEAILQRWKIEGKDDGTPGGHSKATRKLDYSDWLPGRRARS